MDSTEDPRHGTDGGTPSRVTSPPDRDGLPLGTLAGVLGRSLPVDPALLSPPVGIPLLAQGAALPPELPLTSPVLGASLRPPLARGGVPQRSDGRSDVATAAVPVSPMLGVPTMAARSAPAPADRSADEPRDRSGDAPFGSVPFGALPFGSTPFDPVSAAGGESGRASWGVPFPSIPRLGDEPSGEPVTASTPLAGVPHTLSVPTATGEVRWFDPVVAPEPGDWDDDPGAATAAAAGPQPDGDVLLHLPDLPGWPEPADRLGPPQLPGSPTAHAGRHQGGAQTADPAPMPMMPSPSPSPSPSPMPMPMPMPMPTGFAERPADPATIAFAIPVGLTPPLTRRARRAAEQAATSQEVEVSPRPEQDAPEAPRSAVAPQTLQPPETFRSPQAPQPMETLQPPELPQPPETVPPPQAVQPPEAPIGVGALLGAPLPTSRPSNQARPDTSSAPDDGDDWVELPAFARRASDDLWFAGNPLGDDPLADDPLTTSSGPVMSGPAETPPGRLLPPSGPSMGLFPGVTAASAPPSFPPPPIAAAPALPAPLAPIPPAPMVAPSMPLAPPASMAPAPPAMSAPFAPVPPVPMTPASPSVPPPPVLPSAYSVPPPPLFPQAAPGYPGLHGTEHLTAGAVPPVPSPPVIPPAPVLQPPPVPAGPPTLGPPSLPPPLLLPPPPAQQPGWSPPAGMPVDPGDGLPGQPTGENPLQRPRADRGEARPTGSMPLIRPPVALRRPDEEEPTDVSTQPMVVRGGSPGAPRAKELFTAPVARPKDAPAPTGGARPTDPTEATSSGRANLAPPTAPPPVPAPVAPKPPSLEVPLDAAAMAARTGPTVPVPMSPPGSRPPATIVVPLTGPTRGPTLPPPTPQPAPAPEADLWPGPSAPGHSAPGRPAGGAPDDGRPGAPSAAPPWSQVGDPARPATTIVPSRGRSRRSGRSSGHAHEAADDERFGLEESDAPDRSRLLSMIVFWAPALILLVLAGIVVWVVR